MPRFGRSDFQQRQQKGKGRGKKGYRSKGKGYDQRRQFYQDTDREDDAYGSYTTLPAIHEQEEPDEQAAIPNETSTYDKNIMTQTPLSSGACQFVPTSTTAERTPTRKGSAYDDIFGTGERTTVGQGQPRHPPGLGPAATATGATSSSFSAPSSAVSVSASTHTCYRCFSAAIAKCGTCNRSFCICHGFKGHLMVMLFLSGYLSRPAATTASITARRTATRDHFSAADHTEL